MYKDLNNPGKIEGWLFFFRFFGCVSVLYLMMRRIETMNMSWGWNTLNMSVILYVWLGSLIVLGLPSITSAQLVNEAAQELEVPGWLKSIPVHHSFLMGLHVKSLEEHIRLNDETYEIYRLQKDLQTMGMRLGDQLQQIIISGDFLSSGLVFNLYGSYNQDTMTGGLEELMGAAFHLLNYRGISYVDLALPQGEALLEDVNDYTPDSGRSSDYSYGTPTPSTNQFDNTLDMLTSDEHTLCPIFLNQDQVVLADRDQIEPVIDQYLKRDTSYGNLLSDDQRRFLIEASKSDFWLITQVDGQIKQMIQVMANFDERILAYNEALTFIGGMATWDVGIDATLMVEFNDESIAQSLVEQLRALLALASQTDLIETLQLAETWSFALKLVPHIQIQLENTQWIRMDISIPPTLVDEMKALIQPIVSDFVLF